MKPQERLEPILKWMHTAPYPHERHEIPFITISRQAGAGGDALAKYLADRLNQVCLPGPRWATWDRELVERLVIEEHIPEKALEELEWRRKSSWLIELFSGLSSNEDVSDQITLEMYRRIARVIRVIAEAGRAILVGRGGYYVTKDLPAGIHVRLVAPLEARIQQFSERNKLSWKEAEGEIQQIEQRRAAFLHRFFPKNPLQPEDFTITLNTAVMTVEQQVACIIPLVLIREEEAKETLATRSAQAHV